MKETITAEWNRFCHASFAEKCRSLAFVCLCIFVLDVSVTGGGRYLLIGSVSFRMIMALLSFVLCLPTFLVNFRKYVTNPILLMFAVYLLYLLLCAVRGYYGDGKMNVLISDLKGFFWLFLVPVSMAVITNKRRFRTVISILLLGSLIQVAIVWMVNFFCTFVLETSKGLESLFINYQVGTIDRITGSFYRIFMNSCPYLITGCSIALFRQVQSKKNLWRYKIAIAFLLVTLLLSFTRSLYGGVFVVAACSVAGMIFFYKADIRDHIKRIALSVTATCCLIAIMEFAFTANYFNFALSRTFGMELRDSVVVEFRETVDEWAEQVRLALAKPQDPSQSTDEKDMEEEKAFQEEYIGMTQESDNLRAETKRELKNLIRKRPIFGNGLGAYANVRDTGTGSPRDGLDEYFYLDMLARMGIVGLLLYVIPFGYVLIQCYQKKEQFRDCPDGIALLCGMAGFWAVTWFNPWMNAVLGIAAYALCCTLPQILNDK